MSFRLTRPYVRSWGPGEKCSCEVGLAKIAHKSAAAKSETPVDANLNCARCVRNKTLVARGRMGSVDLDKVAGEKGLANPTSQVQEACDDAVDAVYSAGGGDCDAREVLQFSIREDFLEF